MILNVIVALMIVGIAFYQAIHGLFSAMIMAILTVLGAVIAFNYYDALGEVLAGRLGEYAHGVSLLALFALPLLGLRLVFDRIIRGNVLLGVWADRIAGGALGLVASLVIVGMLTIIVQLLPLEASIFGYQPYDAALTKKDGGPIRLAGKFTLGLAGRLSAGCLQPIFGETRFETRHDDLLLEAYCARSRPRGGRAGAQPDALEVDRAFVLSPDQPGMGEILDSAPGYREPLLGADETKVVVVRVKVNQSARSERKDDNWFRLPATHFRLVAKSGRSFYPVGYLTYAGVWRLNTAKTEEQVAKVGEILVTRPWQKKGGPAKLTVDWVYRLPQAESPVYLAFRRTALAPVMAAAEGVPPRQGQGALRPSSVRTAAKFLPGQRDWLLTPRSVLVTASLPEKLSLKIVGDAIRPKAIQSWAHEEGRLKSARIVGSWKGLAGRGKGKYVRDFQLTGAQVVMAQVTCDVKSAGRSLAALRRVRPALMLDNGDRFGHQGAVFLYVSDRIRQTYWYYDTVRPDEPFDSMFTQAVMDHARTTEKLVIYFAIPADRNLSVVTLRFDDAADPKRSREFALERPLMCRGRR